MIITISKKKLCDAVYCFITMFVILLNIYAYYIGSRVPRTFAYLLIICLFLMYLGSSKTCTRKYKISLLLVSISFIVISINGMILYGNYSWLSSTGLYILMHYSTYLLLGAILASEVQQENRITIYKLLLLFIVISAIIPLIVPGTNYGKRAYSIFKHPIIFAQYTIIGILISRFYCQALPTKIAVFILLAYSLLTTYARSGWIGLACILLLVLFSKKNFSMNLPKKKLVRIVVVSLVALLICVFSFQKIIQAYIMIHSLIELRFSGTMNSLSATQRLGTIMYFLQNFKLDEFIFGKGYGASSLSMLNTKITLENFSTTDNQYVSIIYDFGVVGFMWILALFKMVVTSYFQSVKQNDHERNFLCLSIMSLLIGAFFFEITGWPNLSPLLFIFIGMLYQLNHLKDVPRPIIQ